MNIMAAETILIYLSYLYPNLFIVYGNKKIHIMIPENNPAIDNIDNSLSKKNPAVSHHNIWKGLVNPIDNPMK